MKPINQIRIYVFNVLLLFTFFAQARQSSSDYHQWLELSSDQLLKMGDDYTKAGTHNDSAMVCYTIIANRYGKGISRQEKALTARALNEMGILNTTYFNNYTTAYNNLISAYDICQEIHNDELIPYILLNLGNLYNLYEFFFSVEGQPSRAREIYEQSFWSACKTRQWSMVINSYINFTMLGMPYGVGDASVHNEMQRWLNDSIPHDTPDWQFTKYFLDGSLALLKKDYDQALSNYRLMGNCIEHDKFEARTQYMAYTCISAVHVQQENYDSIIYYSNKILKLESQQDLTDIQIETFRFLSEYYSKLGDTEQASYYHVAFLEKKEKMMKGIVGILPTQLTHDLQGVSDEVKKMKEQKRYNNIILTAAAIIIGLLLLISFFIKRKNKELNLKNEALYNKMTEIIHLDEARNATKTIEKYKDSTLDEEKKMQLVEKIKMVMSDSKMICQPSFTLRELAQQLGTNTSYLSQTINESFGMTFTHLLNLYRVKEACRRIEDKEHYGNLTINAISESVGFKARVTFTKAFKQHVGMLPSEYLKAADSHQSKMK